MRSISKRILWLDVVRVMAVFLMVVIHVAAFYVLGWRQISASDWLVANFYDSLARVCVPWFLMVSGVLLLDEKKNGRGGFFPNLVEFYKTRLPRLIKPWILWGSIYFVFGVLSLWKADLIWKMSFGIWFGFITRIFWSGFWILPVFLGAYVAAPFLNWLIHKLGQRFLLSYLVITFGLLFLGIHLPLSFEYSFYFVAGYALRHTKLDKNGLIGNGVLFGLSFLSVFLGTWYLLIAEGKFSDFFYDFGSWAVMAMSLSGFVLVKNLVEKYEQKWKRRKEFGRATLFLAKVGQVSFGIYLSHMLPFKWWPNIWLLPYPVVSIPIVSGLIFAGSYWVLRILWRGRWRSWVS